MWVVQHGCSNRVSEDSDIPHPNLLTVQFTAVLQAGPSYTGGRGEGSGSGSRVAEWLRPASQTPSPVRLTCRWFHPDFGLVWLCVMRH